jgi:hypothetical protein
MRGSLFGLSLKALIAIAITLVLGVGAMLAAAGVAGSPTVVSRATSSMLAGAATVTPNQTAIVTATVTHEAEGTETPEATEPPEGTETPEATEPPEGTDTPIPAITATPVVTGTPGACQLGDQQAGGEGNQPAAALASYFHTSLSIINGYKQAGFGYGEIAKAYFIAQASGRTVDEILAMRRACMGWGEIEQQLGVHPAGNLGTVMKAWHGPGNGNSGGNGGQGNGNGNGSSGNGHSNNGSGNGQGNGDKGGVHGPGSGHGKNG